MIETIASIWSPRWTGIWLASNAACQQLGLSDTKFTNANRLITHRLNWIPEERERKSAIDQVGYTLNLTGSTSVCVFRKWRAEWRAECSTEKVTRARPNVPAQRLCQTASEFLFNSMPIRWHFLSRINNQLTGRKCCDTFPAMICLIHSFECEDCSRKASGNRTRNALEDAGGKVTPITWMFFMLDLFTNWLIESN